MITGPKRLFVALCRRRGYSLDDVAACVVSEVGDNITVDETHAAYPRQSPHHSVRSVGGRIVASAATADEVRQLLEKSSAVPGGTALSGPGTQLKKLLGRIGIKATPNCACNAKARAMDAHGCDWCEANIDTVVGWLREEAGKRRLPWLDAVGKVLVRRAISNARKEMARAEAAKEGEATGSGSAV